MLEPTAVILEDKPCPLDCPIGDDTIFVGRDRLHNIPGEFSVVRCRTCGLIRTNPRPTPSTIGRYYPDDYGPYVSTRISGSIQNEKSLIKRFLGPSFHRVFRFNTTILPDLPPGKLLEVGCASGAFLSHMAMKGWEVEGVEFSPKAAEHAQANGLKVNCGALETAPDPEKLFDLIIGWMVIEHLHDPVAGLSKLARWTKPNGWLAISVPNASSIDFTLFKDAGYALQLPSHLYHFTPRTLTLLLSRSGWRVQEIYHQRGISNLVGSLGYKLEDWGLHPTIVEAFKHYPEKSSLLSQVLFYPLAYLLAIFGQTGRMTVWAKKADD